MSFVFILILVNLSIFSFAQNLNSLYNKESCGLNYTQASILITNRMVQQGFNGTVQPSPLIITGIPTTFKIEQAYVWWDLAGKDTSQNIILKNPSNVTDTFAGILIGSGNNQCSGGKGAAFRAEVTSLISGNGTYYVSGLPSDTTFDFNNFSDVNGATLMIIYSDKSASFIGKIVINDGYLKVAQDTIIETISGTSTIFDEDTSMGNAFMLISELENKTGTSLQMNGGPFITFAQNFWDYEEKSTIFPFTQNNSLFGFRAPQDCGHLIFAGVYFQTPTPTIEPYVSISGDILSASVGNSFQWYLNNSLITNSISQTYLASQSGTYFVEVFDNYGCSFFSDTVQMTICAEKIKPNINFSSPDSLWTDSVDYNLQWYLNGIAILGANESSYTATTSGSYWVQAQDNTGCSVNSNIITVTIDGVSERQRFDSQFTVFPNPGTGIFTILNLYGAVYGLELFNIAGEKIYDEKKVSEKSHRIKADFAKGVYFLKISGEENFTVKKVAVE